MYICRKSINMKKIATIIIAISIMFSFISCQAYRDKKEKERIELKNSIDSLRRLRDTLKSLQTHCYVMTEPYLSPEKKLVFNFKNLSEKKIKYIYFTFEFYNRVGDLVKCRVRDSESLMFRKVGPFTNGNLGYWATVENAIYNNEAVKAVPIKIEIQFMDDNFIFLEKEEIKILSQEEFSAAI